MGLVASWECWVADLISTWQWVKDPAAVAQVMTETQIWSLAQELHMPQDSQKRKKKKKKKAFLTEQGLPASVVTSRVFELKSSLEYFFFAIGLFFFYFFLFRLSVFISWILG